MNGNLVAKRLKGRQNRAYCRQTPEGAPPPLPWSSQTPNPILQLSRRAQQNEGRGQHVPAPPLACLPASRQRMGAKVKPSMATRRQRQNRPGRLDLADMREERC